MYGDIVAGPLVRKACERHLGDLKEGSHRGLTWSLEKSDRVFRYFRSVLRLNGGQFEGKPFELRLWQAFKVGSIFGWTGPDGYRRFRTAYMEEGKGNGKSPLAGGIGLYCLTADDEARAEVYAAASTKDQAQILFRDAVAMRDQSPHLASRIVTYGGLQAWNMFYPKTHSFFRTISSDDKQSGPRPHCALCDEVHEHPDGTVLEMLHAGFKFRRQPLIVEITNSGVDRNSICYQHHEYSDRILRARISDDAWFAYICSLDPKDDWRDPSVWIKANPNLGVSVTQKYLEEQVKKAEGMPASQSKIKRLNFCMWVDAATPWIDGDKWRACESEELELSKYLGSRSFGGLDLSGRNDLTAEALAFDRPDGSGGIDAFVFFWTPEEGLRAREDRDRVPYTLWRDEGHIEATPGATVQYSYVARRTIEFVERYGLEALAFDRYRIEEFKRELDDENQEYTVVGLEASEDEIRKALGLLLVQHGQGFKDMTGTVEAIDEAIRNGQLRVKWNPALTMSSANAVISTDPADGKKFDKRKSTGRIDGIVALAMAIRCLLKFRERRSGTIYDEEDLLLA